MNIWFLILIGLGVLSLGGIMAKHGEKRNDRYNFWSSLISYSIEIFLIYEAIKVGF